MKTPIKDKTKKNNSSEAIREIIPDGSIVDSYGFYNGKVEFSLSRGDIFVNAHTSSYPVYVFWEYFRRDPERLCQLVDSKDFLFPSEMYTIFQEKWHTYDCAAIRAAMFFVMNRSSDTGLISSGQLDPQGFSPVSISNLKKFIFPENFYLNLEERKASDLILKSDSSRINLIIGGKFSYNFFDNQKSKGIEETLIDHRQIIKSLKKSPSKSMIVYDYSRQAEAAAKNLNKIFVDEFGRTVNDNIKAEEIIIANF